MYYELHVRKGSYAFQTFKSGLLGLIPLTKMSDAFTFMNVIKL
jgi:hypothetical protein